MIDFLTNWDSEKAQALLAILSFPLAVWGILQARRANKLARDIAKAQNLLGDSELDLTLGSLGSVSELIIVAPLSDKKVFSLPIEYIITNTGEKAAVDVELQVKINKELHPPDAMKYRKLVKTIAKRERFKILDETDSLSTYAFQFKKIEAGHSAGIRDWLRIIRATIDIESEVETITKDNVPVKLKYVWSAKHVIKFWLTCSDYSDLSVSIPVSIIDADKTDVWDYLNGRADAVLNKYYDRRKGLNVFQRVRTYFNMDSTIIANHKVSLILLDPAKAKKHPDSESLYECDKYSFYKNISLHPKIINILRGKKKGI